MNNSLFFKVSATLLSLLAFHTFSFSQNDAAHFTTLEFPSDSSKKNSNTLLQLSSERDSADNSRDNQVENVQKNAQTRGYTHFLSAAWEIGKHEQFSQWQSTIETKIFDTITVNGKNVIIPTHLNLITPAYNYTVHFPLAYDILLTSSRRTFWTLGVSLNWISKQSTAALLDSVNATALIHQKLDFLSFPVTVSRSIRIDSSYFSMTGFQTTYFFTRLGISPFTSIKEYKKILPQNHIYDTYQQAFSAVWQMGIIAFSKANKNTATTVELSYHGSYTRCSSSSLNLAYMKKLLEIGRRKNDLQNIITHRFSLGIGICLLSGKQKILP